MRASRGVLGKELARRERMGKSLPERVLVGAMIEIPAAAWEAGRIAEVADFLSIGGNDLAQFFFAADRESERVSRRYDPLCSGFLSFVGHAAREAQAAGKPIGYCDEQDSDPLMALALLGLGLRSLSVTASAIGPLKAMIRTVDLAALGSWLERAEDGAEGSLRRDIDVYARQSGIVLPDWS